MASNAPVRPTGAATAPDALSGAVHDRQRIVVGVDGSACGAAALDWALRQAVLLGATVDAVACWHVPAMVSGVGGWGSYVDVSALDLAGPTSEMLSKTVAAALGEVPGAEAVTVRPSVVAAYPARALLQAAEGADLLVVGSRGHGEVSGMLLGSVGLHCVTHAPCPVVVVRAPAASPPGD